MTKKRSAPVTALHARPEALKRVVRWTADPYLTEPRPTLEQVHVEANGRCVATNSHVLAIYDSTTPPAEQPYPDYQRVIPADPPAVKVLVSLPYLRQALKQLSRLSTGSVELEVWADNKPLKLSASDEDGTLTLYVMPQRPPGAALYDVSTPEPDAEDGVPF